MMMYILKKTTNNVFINILNFTYVLLITESYIESPARGVQFLQ